MHTHTHTHTHTHIHTHTHTPYTHMHTPHTHSQHTHLHASKEWTLPEQGLYQMHIIDHRNFKSIGPTVHVPVSIFDSTVCTNTQPLPHSPTNITHTHPHTNITLTQTPISQLHPHWYPTHPHTHTDPHLSHMHTERRRDEGLVRGRGLAQPHLHALWTKLMLVWILAGREWSYLHLVN